MMMKKKYVLSLVLIGIMLLFTLTIGTGYGLWVSVQKDDSKNATTLDCFKVYFSTQTDTIEMKNINTIVNEESTEVSPYTLTITNICDTDKELQLRLNVLKETTATINALTLEAAGNIEQETILYKNLKSTKTTDEEIINSKLIGLISVKPNETVRTNIKMWFDEKKAPNMPKDAYFKGKFQLIDTASAIKYTFDEIILNEASENDSKESPEFNSASYKAEGLYLVKANGGNNYYYRGVVNNNYVKFAGYTWRIVRINPDKTIRLVLDKSAGTTNYSSKKNYMDFTGFKYLYNDEYINNNVTTYLENWYRTTLSNRGYDKYIVESNYCNDSSNYIENYHTYFNTYKRVAKGNNAPTLTCPATTADFGGSLKLKVGLLTADEIIMAGGAYGVNNQSYYLYNGESFFTMSGADFYRNNANMFIVTNTGSLTTSAPTNQHGIRPVINLISGLTVSGSGTINDPYTIDGIE